MDFTSLHFLEFLAALAIAHRLCPARFRAILIAAASYWFYYTWSGAMALLLLGATVGAFLAARAIESSEKPAIRRGVMAALVCALAGALAFFKSAWFLKPLLHYQVLMPLGVSYYTFKLIGYVVDVYWGKTPAERSLVAFAAYAAFFPQIVAGPIERGEAFLVQIHKAPPARLAGVVLGAQRILLGYFKKFIVADNLALVVNFVYQHLRGAPLVAGFYAYPLQLYADFSGLTDIAIGAGLWLGIETAENFNAPFAAWSPSEFWRRWHITLTCWLSDYVFTPLRMATRALGNAGLVLSLLVNMVLIGVWHGFRWTFVLFGFSHAIYLSVDALTARQRKRYYKRHPGAEGLTTWLGRILVFHLVSLSLVLFRAETVGDTVYMLGHLGQAIGSLPPQFLTFLATSGRATLTGLAGWILAELADYLRRHNPRGQLVAGLPRWARWGVYGCTAASAALAVVCLLASDINRNPFIYAIF
jgi:alginate O-acetyltransferase complex protein AlgI